MSAVNFHPSGSINIKGLIMNYIKSPDVNVWGKGDMDLMIRLYSLGEDWQYISTLAKKLSSGHDTFLHIKETE